MPRNVEVKAKVHNWDHTRKECEALSKSAGETLAQRDVFFNTEHGRLKLRDFQFVIVAAGCSRGNITALLLWRHGFDPGKSTSPDGRGQLIYYERPDLQGPKLSNYSISSTSDPHGLEEVLTQALGVRGSVVKQRLLFLVGQTRIHLDRVQDLGDFLELEVVLTDSQTIEDGNQIADGLMKSLGIACEDLLTCAYIDLLQKQKEGQ
uniref:CYTH domain-containing protein n=1 Tax=Leptobrachium leishanense TaxID=445787 RepID=A0A8C5MVB0_9ANUR